MKNDFKIIDDHFANSGNINVTLEQLTLLRPYLEREKLFESLQNRVAPSNVKAGPTTRACLKRKFCASCHRTHTLPDGDAYWPGCVIHPANDGSLRTRLLLFLAPVGHGLIYGSLIFLANNGGHQNTS